MTKYKIGADEVSLVLKTCSFDGKGKWTGELNTGLVVGEQNLLSPEYVSYLVHLATLMGAFLELAQRDEDLYAMVEEHRNELVGYDSEEEPLYERVEGTEGKVLKLTRFTKTQGNA